MLDRAFTVATSILIGVPPPETVRRSNREARAMRAFLAAQGYLDDPAAYHRAPPPVTEWLGSEEVGWVGPRRLPYQHVMWRSAFEPLPGEPGGERWMARGANRTVHAQLLEHRGGPRPWLVCVHGFGMGTPLANFHGFSVRHLHEELGLNLILPCLPLHGPRGTARLSGAELLAPDYLNLLYTFAQATSDVRQAIAFARSRGAEAVGLYGISLGGYISALVAGLEPDLACVVAAIPMVDLGSAARDNEPWLFRRYEEEFQVDFDVVRAITHVCSPLALEPKLPRERRFICAGAADRVVRPNHARALWRHWDRPAIHWFPGSHVLGMFHPEVRTFVDGALRRSRLVAKRPAAA